MTMVSRFDCYPSDFLNGLVGMTADQIATYTVVIMLQYDREGPVRLEGRERELATRAGLTRARLGKAVSDLVELGKVEVADGYLINDRTVQELEKISRIFQKNRQNSAKGGEATKRNSEEKSINSMSDIGRPAADRLADREPSRAPLPSPSPLSSRDLSVSCPNGASPPVRTRNGYPSDFEEFWAPYPTDSNMSKKAAASVWGRLRPDERLSAVASVPQFVRYCHAHPDYRAVHAEKFLRDKRWEGHLKAEERTTGLVFVEHGSDEWRAWQDYLAAQGKRGSPTTEKQLAGRLVLGWDFPSKMPPQNGVHA